MSIWAHRTEPARKAWWLWGCGPGRPSPAWVQRFVRLCVHLLGWGCPALPPLYLHTNHTHEGTVSPKILSLKESSSTSKAFAAPSLALQAIRRPQMIEENSSHIIQQPCPPSGNKGSRWQMKFKARFFCGLPQKITCPIALQKPEMLLLSEMASGHSLRFPSVSSGGYSQQQDWQEAKPRSHLCCNKLHSGYDFASCAPGYPPASTPGPR